VKSGKARIAKRIDSVVLFSFASAAWVLTSRPGVVHFRTRDPDMIRLHNLVWWVTALLGATFAIVGVRAARRRAKARRVDVVR
jgi:hypothetical protein